MSQPQFPKMITAMRQNHVTQITSNIYSVNPGAARSSPEVFKDLVLESNFGRPVVSSTYSAARHGMEKITYARIDRRLKSILKAMKRALTVRVPI